jgi:hypothetical protein
MFCKGYSKSKTVFCASNKCAVESNYLAVLVDALSIVNEMILQFSAGQFDIIAQNLTLSKYNSMSLILSKLQKNSQKYPTYEAIRVYILNTLQGLMQSVNQYALLSDTNIQLLVASEKAAILQDMTKLQEYLTHLRGSRSVFPESNVTVTRALIKPEYGEYIKRHGYPPNGIFNPDKLAECILYVSRGI